MLTFSSEQLEGLSIQRRLLFRERAARLVLPIIRTWSDVAGIEESNAFVENAMDLAHACGISRELDVIHYIELLAHLGPSRYRSPEWAWLREILAQDRPATDRFQAIAARLAAS